MEAFDPVTLFGVWLIEWDSIILNTKAFAQRVIRYEAGKL